MSRNRYAGFFDEHNRGFLVAFDLHWRIIDARRIDPAIGACRALELFIIELQTDGWLCEGEPTYGFVFMKREGQRISGRSDTAGSFEQGVPKFRSVQMS